MFTDHRQRIKLQKKEVTLAVALITKTIDGWKVESWNKKLATDEYIVFFSTVTDLYKYILVSLSYGK